MASLRALVAVFLLALGGAAHAGEARPVADDPVLEARVSKLAQELRCLVCQNQTLEDSHAPLAIDLKNQVREMLASGRSESEVVDYLVARYGDFVLYRPPLKATTLLLWIGPLLLLAISLAALVHHIRRGTAAAADDPRVDAQAARRADALLGLHPGKDSP
ncbi:MAG TPA: cytochrome c-type biogenesis protein [Usitatibacter sp.]|nr:cytochrome c-type biogenesis protein [Usitatibacter sp.]